MGGESWGGVEGLGRGLEWPPYRSCTPSPGLLVGGLAGGTRRVGIVLAVKSPVSLNAQTSPTRVSDSCLPGPR